MRLTPLLGILLGQLPQRQLETKVERQHRPLGIKVEPRRRHRQPEIKLEPRHRLCRRQRV